MTALTQSDMDKAQDMLDYLIETAMGQSVHCCNIKDGSGRDRYNMIASYLLAAKSISGGIDVGGVQPRFGGK